jgi:hypothetical protein
MWMVRVSTQGAQPAADSSSSRLPIPPCRPTPAQRSAEGPSLGTFSLSSSGSLQSLTLVSLRSERKSSQVAHALSNTLLRSDVDPP